MDEIKNKTLNLGQGIAYLKQIQTGKSVNSFNLNKNDLSFINKLQTRFEYLKSTNNRRREYLHFDSSEKDADNTDFYLRVFLLEKLDSKAYKELSVFNNDYFLFEEFGKILTDFILKDEELNK